MDKGLMASSSGENAISSQLPSAPPLEPPSYEEAVGLSSGASVPGVPGMPVSSPVPGAPPYPVSGTQMPMPTPYIAPVAQVPLHTQVTNQTRSPEVRVDEDHIITILLGPHPIKMSCPSCHADIKTTTMSDHQPSAHVCCIILCLLGCCLCSCLPYCLSAFLSVHHFCPNCKTYIGTWKG